MNISYIFSFVSSFCITFVLIFVLIFVKYNLVISNVITITKIKTFSKLLSNIVYSALKMSLINSVFLIKIKQFSVKIKGRNNMNTIKIRQSSKYQYVLDFSKLILSEYNISENTRFEIKESSNKFSLVESISSDSISVCFIADGRARLTVPANLIKKYNIKDSDELKISKRKGLIKLVYEVPKKVLSADDIQKKLDKEKAKIKALKQKQLQTV